ncbi:hypothetical protein K1T73_11540 [Roseovarius sp. SCSIO 43702]|uniref:DUF4129 domain-containing protein n=1 Tax=Roseovarius sp. SCSIO 43702 TaxID=2823043 RepID=UPI001C73C6C2|nr:DUF4129 domain-containing protein [Roseovarius sp. SCSIO 43702]QYX55716.1 hypothetical protein K1T73_11540 [Roseovarius sp. SCSIO 43702]
MAPPRDGAEDYLSAARDSRVETELRYADRIDPDLLTDENPEIEPAAPPRSAPSLRIEGGFGVFLMIALVTILLFLWLRFGGSGALLSATPRESDGAQEAPEAWKIGSDETAMDGRSLLDRIRAMPDRREALVHLLRHALLAAGDEAQVRFARSDTEREAFARLPEGWRHRDLLRLLLRAAELAHYGGRPVSEEAFENALQQGAAILGPRRGGAAHG